MFFKKIVLFTFLSLLFANDLDPIEIINKSINRFNGINIEFESSIKQQSINDEPRDFNLDFKTYWPYGDSLFCYNYIKFNSPIDYKDIEIWGYYNTDTILVRKRLPIDNKITAINKDSENADIINLFNFMELFDEVKDKNFSIKDSEINGKELFYIKAFLKRSKKKATKIYIDKEDYSIYKIEWTDKRGRINKSIKFDNWSSYEFANKYNEIGIINFSKKIIYEDIKKGSKITCKLNDVKFNKISDSSIKKIELGFDFEK